MFKSIPVLFSKKSQVIHPLAKLYMRELENQQITDNNDHFYILFFFSIFHPRLFFAFSQVTDISKHTCWSLYTLVVCCCFNQLLNRNLKILLKTIKYLRQGSGPGRKVLLLKVWSMTQKMESATAFCCCHLDPNPAPHRGGEPRWW